jgi:small acid-soluble spore protein I (minor)
MNVDIRQNIIENFKDADTNEIKTSVMSGIESKEEITLPGLGVFFELLWINSDDDGKEYILNTIKKGLQ